MRRTPDIRAVLFCGLAALHVFSAPLLTFGQEPSPTPGVGPPPATVPTSEQPEEPKKPEEEKVAPTVPPTVPGIPVVEDVLDLQAPGPTTPSPPPGLIGRFQQQLALVPPGRLEFNLTVEEVYDDNAFNVSTGREADFITLIVPAVTLDRTRGKTSLRLQYTPRILQYIRFPELNRVDHTLNAAASWDPNPWLRISLRNNLLITQNVAEEASSLGISQVGLRKTTQNVLSPALDFKLTPRSDLALQYANIIVDEEDTEDKTINGARIGWRYTLPRGGVSLAYSVAYVDRELTSNSLSHQGTLTTSWRLNPSDLLSLTAAASFVDNERGDNTGILGGSVGFNHQFSPQLSGTVTGGVQGFGVQGGDSNPAFSTNSNLVWTFPRGSLTLAVAQGFKNTFATVDDVGVVQDTMGSASLSYQAGPSLNLSVDGSYSRVEFQEQDQTDYVGRLRINIRYQLGILALTAGYNFFDRNSDGGSNLTTNRVFIGLSLGTSTSLPLF